MEPKVFTADRVVSLLAKRARKVRERGADTAPGTLAGTGLEGDYEREVRFRPEAMARVSQVVDKSHPQKVYVQTYW